MSCEFVTIALAVIKLSSTLLPDLQFYAIASITVTIVHNIVELSVESGIFQKLMERIIGKPSYLDRMIGP